jgi:dTDP-4-dehydrorhamnose 3,5-epimerase
MLTTSTPIAGVVRVESTAFRDSRGSLTRLFCDQELAPILQGRKIRQTNLTSTAAVGAIRGMHYQNPPAAEMKFVRCLSGRVWDVAVDLRAGSPTYLRWHAEELSPERALMLVIPEGCAHGFQVLEANSQLLYLHTAPYRPDLEAGLRFDDPKLAIAWPLPAQDLSQRDQTHPFLHSDFPGICL